MAKKSRGTSTSPRNEQDYQTKQQKKQAKKEAKLMLAVEQGKASLEKARNKLAKARARVDARVARLRDLEAALEAQRASSQPAQMEAPDGGFDHQQGQPEPQEVPTEESTPAHSPDENDHPGAAQEESEASPAPSTEEPAGSPAEEPATSDEPEQAPATSNQQSDQSGETSPAATVTKRPTIRSLRSRITRRASGASGKPDRSPAPSRRAVARGRSNTGKTTAHASKRDTGA